MYEELFADKASKQITRNTDSRFLCMCCCATYGVVKDKHTGIKSWHPRAAKTIAYWKITSSGGDQARFYCLHCIGEFENIDDEPYPIQDQLRDGAEIRDRIFKGESFFKQFCQNLSTLVVE